MEKVPDLANTSSTEALRAFSSAIVESSDDAIIATTVDGRIAGWNQGAEQIYGYSAEEAVGRHLTLLALPERHDEVRHILERICRGERVRHYETMHLRKDGRVISVSLALSPIKDGAGRILGASAISRDVTRRIHYEESLRQAEKKYRLLFAAELDAIIVTDAETGQVIDYNEAALRLYDYPPEAFCRMKLEDLVIPTPMEPRRSIQTEVGTVLRVPLEYHRKRDGSIFPAERSLSSFVWQGRRMQVGVVRDVSELQRGRELDKSLRIAGEIQQHLLPSRAPSLPGFDIAAGSRYCEATGGDYYDFISWRDAERELMGCVVGDVSGHGIPAALLMAMAKGGIMSSAERFGADLTGLFHALNRHLVRTFKDDRFMTLFYAWLDPVARSLWWTSAAHGPVFHYRAATQTIDELTTTGPPLGVAADSDYPSCGPLLIAPGDLLLIGTDGLWEARNDAGEMFGAQRIRQLLTDWADDRAAVIYEMILDKVQAFCAASGCEDDMTLMVIKAL